MSQEKKMVEWKLLSVRILPKDFEQLKRSGDSGKIPPAILARKAIEEFLAKEQTTQAKA